MAQGRAEPELNARTFELLDFGVEDGARKGVLRRLGSQAAARDGIAVGDGAGVADPRKVMRRRQTSRTRTDDHH